MILRLIFGFLILFVIVGIIIYYTLASKTFDTEGRELKSNFDGNKFYNIQESETSIIEENKTKDRPSFFTFWKEMRKNKDWEITGYEQKYSVPEEIVEGNTIVATFVNHNTVLIQTEGLNILTDPVWAKRASPFSFVGPKRYTEAGIKFDDLPKIDIVLLSHNHYDHMDIDTLKKLEQKYNPVIYTHLGNKKYLEKRGIKNVIDMDWWDEIKYNEQIKIHSVPAQHFSARAISDRNKTLWGGFVVKTNNGDIYFAGDTGYGPFVNQIKEKYPEGFRFALLPIGAYEPRSFMKEMHTSPDDAVLMYKELGVKTAMGTHFGTFKLSTETFFAPSDRIKTLMMDRVNTNIKFYVFQNGESIIIE